MESPSVCARVLRSVWHRSIWHGADCETPFSHHHLCTRPNFSSCLTSIADFLFNNLGDNDDLQESLSCRVRPADMVLLTQKKETMMDFVWERCSLTLFKACPILTHRTVRRQRNRKCPRGPNRTTATLFAIKWGHDATVLGLLFMAFFSVKLENVLRYGKKSRNASPAFFFFFFLLTVESGSHFWFTSNNSLMTGYMLHRNTTGIQEFFVTTSWCFDK